MNKTTLLTIVVLIVVAVGMGYNYFFQPFSESEVAVVSPAPAPSPSLSPAESLLQNLTPEQRVLQLVAASLTVVPETVSTGSALEEQNERIAWMQQQQPGTVVLFGSNISTTAAQAVVSQVQTTSEITPWIAVDHEGGTVQRLSGLGFTELPSWRALCAEEDLVRQEYLASSSAELRAVGVDIVFAPVVDVASSSAVLGSRVCSGQYEVVTQAAAEYVDIFSQADILPVLKHFPGIGSGRRDLHFQYDAVTVTPADALVYRLLLEDYPELGVMVTHAGVVNQFAELPCTLSIHCVGELAQLYPQTLLFTDALDMVAAGHQEDTTELLPLPQRAEQALLAGNHILVFSQDVTPTELDQVIQTLVTRYTTDAEFKEKVDAAAALVLERKLGG